MRGKRIFRFDLVDFYDYEFGERVFSSDDINEIKKAAKKYIAETDGECALAVADWGNKTLKHL